MAEFQLNIIHTYNYFLLTSPNKAHIRLTCAKFCAQVFLHAPQKKQTSKFSLNFFLNLCKIFSQLHYYQ